MTFRGLIAGLCRVWYMRLLVSIGSVASAIAAWSSRRADAAMVPVLAAVDPPCTWLETVPAQGNA